MNYWEYWAWYQGDNWRRKTNAEEILNGSIYTTIREIKLTPNLEDYFLGLYSQIKTMRLGVA